MVKITVDLLKKRAEHNQGILSSLEEITLHQYDIEKIELIQIHCKHLQILYLQNNLIEKIENLYKLKELKYLNLALNNISKIEGLKTCESLNKLDLTLNFIDIYNLKESITNLKENIFLSELYLTGNPCTDFKYYRLFVIHLLPQLKKLDSIEIKKSEIIKAKQSFNFILKQLEIEIINKQENENDNDEFGHNVKARKNAYYQEKEKQKQETEINKKNKEKNPFLKPKDILKETRKKMCQIEKEGENGQLPKQRNIGKYEFKMEGIDDIYSENIRIVIEAPKYLDTSQIFVDIHPLWFQVIIKNKSLLLHLSDQIKVNQSKIRRILCNGWLELILPKVSYKKKRKQTKEIKQEKKEFDQEYVDEEYDFDINEVPPLE